MVKYSVEDSSLSAIAHEIRMDLDTTDTYTLAEMPMKINDVFETGKGEGYSVGYGFGYTQGEEFGYNNGLSDGYDDAKSEVEEVTVTPTLDAQTIIPTSPNLISKVNVASGQSLFDAGKQSEYDRFWDEFQQNGNRTIYNNAFGSGWTENIFKPKYAMRPTNATYMFFNQLGQSITITDFVEFCRQNNIILDFSNCVSASYSLGNLWTNHHGVLDFSKCTSLSSIFYSQNLVPELGIKKIDEFISSATTVYDATTFQNALMLEDITFSGIIANNIWFNTCTLLTKASMLSIFEALSTITTGKSITLSLTAVSKAFETTPGANDGIFNYEFALLTDTRTNWGIQLL